jgi:hypothetical protein
MFNGIQGPERAQELAILVIASAVRRVLRESMVVPAPRHSPLAEGLVTPILASVRDGAGQSLQALNIIGHPLMSV